MSDYLIAIAIIMLFAFLWGAVSKSLKEIYIRLCWSKKGKTMSKIRTVLTRNWLAMLCLMSLIGLVLFTVGTAGIAGLLRGFMWTALGFTYAQLLHQRQMWRTKHWVLRFWDKPDKDGEIINKNTAIRLSGYRHGKNHRLSQSFISLNRDDPFVIDKDNVVVDDAGEKKLPKPYRWELPDDETYKNEMRLYDMPEDKSDEGG